MSLRKKSGISESTRSSGSSHSRNSEVKIEIPHSIPVPSTAGNTKEVVHDESNGVTFSWNNLNVYAQTKSITGQVKSNVHIIKNVSGVCKPGQFLAVMGASGAGKTTLLNVLTTRAVNLKVTGDMMLNGHPMDPKTLMAVSAYVQQEDLFCKVFTVREQLHFHAQLRIGKDIPREEREAKVEETIKELGLTKCADTLIGDPGRVKGISGGEKKRLAFACEIITNPMLLFCDEPTSGLDSFMAESVTKIMKKMALMGKTVVSTIHQPSSEVFSMFDQLLLLSEGRVAFHGSVSQALDFFSRIGKPCPDDFNPSDHFIYTLAIQGGKEDECKEYVNWVCDQFRDNEGITKQKEIEETLTSSSTDDVISTIVLPKSPYRATYGGQFQAVFRRAGLEVARQKLVLAIKLVQTTFFAFVFGLIYFQQDVTNQKEIGNLSAAMFLFITNVSFANLFPVVTTFAQEMPLLFREHWNGMYRTDIYFWTRSIVEIPVYIIIPIIYNGITYYMVGFREQFKYFVVAMLDYIVVTNVAVSYGYMISCLSKDYTTALTLSTPLTIPLQLFAGFYIKTETIPKYLSWIQYLSWFGYGFEVLSINQWDGFTVSNGTETYDVGSYMLDKYYMDPDDLTLDFLSMVGLFIGFRVIALVFLMIKARRPH